MATSATSSATSRELPPQTPERGLKRLLVEREPGVADLDENDEWVVGGSTSNDHELAPNEAPT